MKNSDLFNESNQATYCPEDNKLRLYVGRVPREEYLALKSEGWTSTPKQSCDFVAVWTPDREDTAISYAGIIGDEDQDPGERAAERAERFAGYLGKRLSEASTHADSFESGPSVHGYQSQERAERAAARHDRLADKAVNQWEKAEYWQRRTEGVISHALYKDLPGVRMGRIKTIEADMRKNVADRQKWHSEQVMNHSVMLAIVKHSEGKQEKIVAAPGYQYCIHYIREADGLEEGTPMSFEQICRVMISTVLSSSYSEPWATLCMQAEKGEIPAADVARKWLDRHGWEAPGEFKEDDSRWYRHFQLRLSYERQMLEAQGGTLESQVADIIPGGWIRGGRRLSNEERQIQKVNKSPKTGRVVSVIVADNRPSSVNHYGNPFPDGVTKTLWHDVDVERLDPSAYRPPTDEELAAFLGKKAAKKAAAPKIQFINPTKEDAQRLQSFLNNEARITDAGKNYPRQASEVSEMTQSRFSDGCADYRTTTVLHGVKFRAYLIGWRGVNSVVVLTDKPQKPFPASFWEKLEVKREVAA
jgi:hypothetical protein